jgi:hypothetical protein
MFGSSKGFEIRGVQEKELPVKTSANINPIGTVICPKQKQNIKAVIIHHPIKSSKNSLVPS